MRNSPKESWQVWESTWARCHLTSRVPPSSLAKRKGCTAGWLSTTWWETSWRWVTALKTFSTTTNGKNNNLETCSKITPYISYTPGVLWQKNLWNAYIRPEGKTTVGSMDLGGASTQIAFAVEEDHRGDDYMLVKLYGYPYNVYTHSFLCYGKNEAEKMLLDKVLTVGEALVCSPSRRDPWARCQRAVLHACAS